ncbi:HAMP domain-containing sensor histidine kinase [Paenibacillus massiliensis]|uniref:HAMP domain-containing sensor histidine kinase n=1 Tax=Paenibacillus massiliensis TaxID=225917 RepID=UPI0003F91AF5|nr:HAMP domain-containing sensor histidine kinase [Paenibacillus massiliensis]
MKPDSSRKRQLKRLFLANYLSIVGLVLVVIVLSLIIMDVLMNQVIDRSPDFKQIDTSELYGPDGSLNGDWPAKYGGWLELVDGEGTIVAVKGEKQDEIAAYRDNRLFAQMDTFRNDDSISYHAYSVERNGERYILLWKIPLPYNKLLLAVIIAMIFFIMLLFVVLYFYTRYSVRQMNKPLRQIVEGIKEMEKFRYEKRLDFLAEKEFAEIRDAFNDMAARLELAAADKEAVEQNKRNLLLHLSHDLKTPMTTVLGYSQLLLDNPQSDESRKRQYIQYIHDKSAYMGKLIQDLFELAKLDDDQLKLNLTKVNLTKWLRQRIVEFYPEIEHKGFRLQADIPETPLYVRMDPMQMDRVVANLIGNALKYNSSGTTLYASCEGKDGHAVLWIGDDGIGFREQEKEGLFEEFVRGSALTKDGTGLGLAICRKIIARHQGTIELVTDKRYPALFRITLPYADVRDSS